MASKDIRQNDKQSKLNRIQKEKDIQKSGEVRKAAFISSRNKRDQAKNDSRPTQSKQSI